MYNTYYSCCQVNNLHVDYGGIVVPSSVRCQVQRYLKRFISNELSQIRTTTFRCLTAPQSGFPSSHYTYLPTSKGRHLDKILHRYVRILVARCFRRIYSKANKMTIAAASFVAINGLTSHIYLCMHIPVRYWKIVVEPYCGKQNS